MVSPFNSGVIDDDDAYDCMTSTPVSMTMTPPPDSRGISPAPSIETLEDVDGILPTAEYSDEWAIPGFE